MNTNMTGLRGLSKIFEESNLSIGRVRKSPRVTIRPSRIRECRTTKLALLGQEFIENKLHFFFNIICLDFLNKIRACLCRNILLSSFLTTNSLRSFA